MPTSTLTVVAHPDDDLLFLAPDIASDILAGYRVTVVYLSAGNLIQGSGGMPYADQRINGVRAAYARAAHVSAPNWTYQLLDLGGRAVATNILPGTNLRLVFMAINGAAGADQVGDLHRLQTNPAFVASPIDSRPSYRREEFLTTLRALYAYAAPDYIRTHDLGGAHRADPDHVDHVAAAHLAGMANTDSHGCVVRPWYEYIGYHCRTMPTNFGGWWATEKLAAIAEYQSHDPAMEPNSWDAMAQRQYRGPAHYPGTLWTPMDIS